MAVSRARGYTDDDLAAVTDNPELTDEQLATAKTFAVALPDLAATMRRRGPQKTPTKKLVSLRLDPDVLEAFRAGGPGWQARINAVLRKAAKL